MFYAISRKSSIPCLETVPFRDPHSVLKKKNKALLADVYLGELLKLLLSVISIEIKLILSHEKNVTEHFK